MARVPTPSPAVRWILTVGIVVVLLVAGYLYYQRLQDEQASYVSSIAQSQHTIDTFRSIDLDELEASIADLRSRADAADRRYTTLMAKYETYVHSIEIEEEMYDAAAAAGVTISRLVCDGPQLEEAGSESLNSYIITMEVESPVPPQILNFLMKISDRFETGVIDEVDLTVPRPVDATQDTSDEDATLEGEDESQPVAKATLQFRVRYAPQEGNW